MRRKSALGILFSFLLLSLSACGGDTSVSKEPTAAIGSPAPQFSLTSVDGKALTLDNFKGKPLVMTFMAEWCPCSNESAPVFKEAYKTYSPKGVEFLVLGFQDSEAKFRKFVEREKFPYPSAFDKGDKVGTSYGVNAPPTTFFITADGKIQRAFYGKLAELDKLSSWIEELLAPPQPVEESPKPVEEKGAGS